MDWTGTPAGSSVLSQHPLVELPRMAVAAVIFYVGRMGASLNSAVKTNTKQQIVGVSGSSDQNVLGLVWWSISGDTVKANKINPQVESGATLRCAYCAEPYLRTNIPHCRIPHCIGLFGHWFTTRTTTSSALGARWRLISCRCSVGVVVIVVGC